MNDTKVGHLIDETAQRDAIHIAIAPVVSYGLHLPGENVGLLADGRASNKATKKIGIIDPFLTDCVKDGERCYLFLYPQTVTGMRHHWQHPDFSAEPLPTGSQVMESKAWLERYIRLVCPYDEDEPDGGYASFMRGVREGEIFYHGTDCHNADEVKDEQELYHHLSVVLGRRIDRRSFHAFSCSC